MSMEKKFNNSHWPALNFIPVPEGYTAIAQGTYDNGDPPFADGRNLYKCDGNNLRPDCPLI